MHAFGVVQGLSDPPNFVSARSGTENKLCTVYIIGRTSTSPPRGQLYLSLQAAAKGITEIARKPKPLEAGSLGMNGFWMFWGRFFPGETAVCFR